MDEIEKPSVSTAVRVATKAVSTDAVATYMRPPKIAPKSNSLDPFNLLKFVVNCIFEVFSYVLGTILNYLMRWLSQSFSITLRMSTVVFFLLFLIACGWALVRYRFMTKYSRLPEDEDSERESDLWLDDDDELPNKSSYNSYFDEFLAAIKIFGYLDKKIFDELTRHMRTYRIDDGETVQLNDLDGFAVVIDGRMQVYVQANGQYQLINEVKKAGPLSSLFSILALLTQEVAVSSKLYRSETKLNNDIPDFDLNSPAPEGPEVAVGEEEAPDTSEFAKLNRDMCAVASEPSRIAVIPSSTFQLLARKYPAQTANIIQVILVRWFQVTVHTCGTFLELTDLIVDAEIDLNRAATSRIPGWIKDGAVKRLKHMAEEDPDQRVFTLKPRRNPGQNSLPKQHHGIHHVSVEQVDKNYPGDLVSNVPILSRHNSVFDQQELLSAFVSSGVKNPNTASSDDSEDTLSRKVVAGEMFKLMGFDGRMEEPKELPSAHRDSMIVSAPNSPALPQQTMSFNFNSKINSKVNSHKSDISSTGELGVPPNLTVSYDEILERASKNMQIMMYREGEVLYRPGERCMGFLYVIDGALSVYDKEQHLYDVHNGNVAGYLETISSQIGYFKVVAKTDVIIARLSKKNFEDLCDTYPMIYISTGKVLTRMLRRSVLLLNFALEWTQCISGETLFREGTDADALYYVVSGRIRAYTGGRDGKKLELKGEYGQGQYLAQLETLLGDKYGTTAIAIRETELARVPRTLIEYMATLYPQTPFKMTKLVAKEVTRKEHKDNRPAVASMSRMQEFSTIAILPASDGLPVQDFASNLSDAFRKNGRDSLLLNRNSVLNYLGKYTFSSVGNLKLKTYLAGVEQQHDTLLYVTDDASMSSQWTRTCIDQADCVLLLADAGAPPTMSDYEKLLVRSKIHHRCHLILLHNDESVRPGLTASWLKRRTWIAAHHHIQMEFESKAPVVHPTETKKRGLKTLKEIKDKIQSEFNDRGTFNKNTTNLAKSQHNLYRFKNDFHRLARILSGEAVGLVLGGGGARGLAHIGVIKALEEKGIPVDMVGGTSIGSFVGGLYARDYDTLSMLRRAKKFAGRFASIWHILLDLTYPASAYTTGHEFNRGIWKAFGNSRIEDFWLRYFNNTTNITHSRMEVHKSGYAWRYIRASMSLAGLVPPLEDKGDMLLDGGYMDNLPVQEMRSLGAKHIIAVDVGSVDDTTPMKYGDSLSGLWVVFNRYNPFSTHPNIPNIAEIQARLAYVSSVQALEDAKSDPSLHYLRPPIDLYATLDFGKFDEIISVGYSYAIRKIQELEDAGVLGQIAGLRDVKERWVPELERRHSF